MSSLVPFNHFNHSSYSESCIMVVKKKESCIMAGLARMYGWRTACFGLGPLGLSHGYS